MFVKNLSKWLNISLKILIFRSRAALDPFAGRVFETPALDPHYEPPVMNLPFNCYCIQVVGVRMRTIRKREEKDSDEKPDFLGSVFVTFATKQVCLFGSLKGCFDVDLRADRSAIRRLLLPG